jgi:hypothetical protein
MVRIAPAPTVQIGPKSSIAAGQPIEHPADPDAPDTPFTVTVQGLKDTVRPAISVPVTFRFEKSGTLDLRGPRPSVRTCRGHRAHSRRMHTWGCSRAG